jgi:hypothetical protein
VILLVSALALSVTRFKDGARLQCVSLRGDALHGHVWNERFCRCLHHPHTIPIPVIARDGFSLFGWSICQACCPRLVCGSISNKWKTLSPHWSTVLCTSLRPGKRGGGDGRSRNPPNPTPPPRLLFHASVQVGRSVRLRLWGDCECGRVVHPLACRAAWWLSW